VRSALRSLSFGNFVIGTGALVFIGMLDTIATDLAVAPAVAGQIAGLFALGICVSGPVLGAVTSRFERRSVLTVSLLLFALGHGMAALAVGYWSLLVVRVLTAFAGALFTPQAAATASLLVPAEQRARSMAFVFLGWSIAAVLGMPAGAWVGAHFGWRTAMCGVAVLSLLGATLTWWHVPARLFVGRVNAAAWRSIGNHPVLLQVVSVTAIHASAQFALFSYLVIAYRDALDASPTLIALMLCLLGVAGFCGNLLAGRIADRIGTPPVVLAAIGMMLTAFVVWLVIFATGPGTTALVLALLAAVLWGAGNFASNSMQQVRLVNLAPELASVSVALNSSAIYLGQFIGAGLGGLVLTHTKAVPASSVLPWVGLPIFVAAMLVSSSAQRRARQLVAASD
jgi:predicted MFS family arabinose efflux permease